MTTWVRRGIIAIAGATMLSGLVMMAVPKWVLAMLDADVSRAIAHPYAIVGMFMVLFGGLLLQAIAKSNPAARMPMFWCAMQKFGAAIAVAIAVAAGLMSPLALGVASFDLFSGGLILWSRHQIPT